MQSHASPGALASTSTLFPIEPFIEVDHLARTVRDMQTALAHKNLATTVRYDRRNLDRHAAYILAAYAGGG